MLQWRIDRNLSLIRLAVEKRISLIWYLYVLTHIQVLNSDKKVIVFTQFFFYSRMHLKIPLESKADRVSRIFCSWISLNIVIKLLRGRHLKGRGRKIARENCAGEGTTRFPRRSTWFSACDSGNIKYSVKGLPACHVWIRVCSTSASQY